MKRVTVVIVAVLLVSTVLASGLVAADGAHAGSDRAPDCPEPGFVSGLVQDVTPDFLQDLIGSLPVPGFVESFFGAGDDC